jgi:hypothetical protein
MGEAFTRHSLHPLAFWRVMTVNDSGASCRESGKACLHEMLANDLRTRFTYRSSFRGARRPSYDAQLRIGESILPIVVMDSGLALRAPRNDGGLGAALLSFPPKAMRLQIHEPAATTAGRSTRIAPTHPIRPAHRQADGHNLGGMKGVGDVPLRPYEFAVPALLMGVVSDIASKRPAMLHIASHLPEKTPARLIARPESRVRKRWSTYVVHL